MENQMKIIYLKNCGHEFDALLLTHWFWLIYDEIYHSNKSKIFKQLYMSEKRSDNTYLKTSINFNLSLRSLERYRKVFVTSFAATIEFLKSENTTPMCNCRRDF